MKKIILLLLAVMFVFSCQLESEDMSQEEFNSKWEQVPTPEGFNPENALHFNTYQEAHDFLSALKTAEDSKNSPAVRHTRPFGITFHIKFNYSWDTELNSWGNRIKLYRDVRNVTSYIAGLRPMQYYDQKVYDVNYFYGRKEFYVRVEGLVTVTIGFKGVGVLNSYHIDGKAYVNQSGRVY